MRPRCSAWCSSEGGLLVGIGLAIGVAGSLSLSSAVKGLLFGVRPHDPATLVIVAMIMAVVGNRRVLDSGGARGADRSGRGAAGAVTRKKPLLRGGLERFEQF